MKIRIILVIIVFIGSVVLAQNMNRVQYDHLQNLTVRKEILIPDILGYHTLKCDFHMHTVFSDGIVWPTFRVDEAWQEGLDAIAISDHIENQPSKKYITGDHNSSYVLALEEAKERNILLIRAGEITRGMPPGHFNVMFVNDLNLLDVPDVSEALKAAKNQGAVIMWNHPGWKAQQPDSCRWWPIHQALYDKGLIDGIEVFNTLEYYPVVLDWCLQKKLTVFCTSDIHDVISNVYDLEKGHRPMTLVFTRERSLESIKEALLEQRTLAYFDNKLAGREEFLKAIFEASVTFKPTGKDTNNRKLFEIRNISTIPFDIETGAGDKFNIPAESTVLITLDTDDSHEAVITNLYTGATNELHVLLNY